MRAKVNTEKIMVRFILVIVCKLLNIKQQILIHLVLVILYDSLGAKKQAILTMLCYFSDYFCT